VATTTTLTVAHRPRRLLALAAASTFALCAILPLACSRSDQPGGGAANVSAELQKFKGLTGKIDIAGGTAHIPVMNEALKRISTVNSDVRITVAGGGSGVGVKKLGEGLVEIGNTGRALTDKEIEAHGLVTFPFALDAVAIIVHPSNPVAALTAEQMQKLYAGEVANWKEVGGPDGAVHLFTRDEASGTREVFWETLLNKGAIADAANVVASNGAVKTAVARDELAIGYISLGHVDESVKAVAIDSQVPTQENAASGKYRVFRKLYMNTRGKPDKLVQTFIDYVRGPEGDAIVREAGFIPVKE
jgi:phosphate transport system substrate-binding protein